MFNAYEAEIARNARQAGYDYAARLFQTADIRENSRRMVSDGMSMDFAEGMLDFARETGRQ